MPVVKKFMMFYLAVNDMPKAKVFYADALGMEVTQDYRQDDNNWWVSLVLPEGGVTITLSTSHGNVRPGAASFYLTTPDAAAARKELLDKNIQVSDVQDDLYGPGSGVQFITADDPDGNKVLLVQE